MASGSGKPLLLLKDYLRDDLSSCSSSGFRSLPRRHCCLQPRSSVKSVLQKALEAVFNAIKSRSCKAKKGGVLSRSFHRRLLNISFWKRSSEGGKATFRSSANSDSWPRSHFTGSLTDAEMEGPVTTTNTCSVTNSARGWPNEEKEQFSPISVLDCPLFNDDEEITSPFNSPSCSTMEGAKHKHIKKSRRFNHVASLKLVDIEKKVSWSELQKDEPIYNHPIKPCPVIISITSKQNGNNNQFRDNVEENALDLLTHVKNSIPSLCLRIEVENLLFDFFKQSIWENIDIGNSMKRHLCKVAEDWIRGQHQEQYVSSQIQKEREIYVKEMDKCGNWRTSDEEIQGLAMELEDEFSISLVNELVVDLTTYYF
ncbi:hypothetical protein E2542_SST07196 [Spatholobus suberectus]|nr:hypothetical protein E2542_SST07196 [Spatholobus suberectus]